MTLALLPMAPDSPQGFAISIAGVFVLFAAQIAGRREIRLDGMDFVLVAISLVLLGFELITPLVTNEYRDFLFALGRLYWIALLVAAVAFTNAEMSRGNRTFIFNVLWVGLVILLVAMLSQSLFYPKFDTGRDYGFVQMPLPRATGVLNPDGKIGTFFEMCLAVGLYYGSWLPRWKRVIFLVGPWIGLFFTQSRSGLVATMAVVACYWGYRCLTERNGLLWAGRWILMLSGIFAVLNYFHVIMRGLINQGGYEKNALGRLQLNSYGLAKVGDAPLLGSGIRATHEYVNGSPIHNTVLGMAVKSGILAGLLMAVIIIYPALAFRGTTRLTFFKWSLVAGFVVEHALYPGFINEFLIVSYIVAKWIWRLDVPPPVRQSTSFPTGRTSGATAYG